MSDEKRSYTADQALYIAHLWDVGKMIGGDENEVIFALMDEVERLRLEVELLKDDLTNQP